MRQGITVDDLVAIKSIESPELSPDGSMARATSQWTLTHRSARPIWQAHEARTPTLFLHGEMDNDTPICEAEQFFMVLKKMGVESRMVRYVDDGHGIRKKLANYLDSLRRTIAWFERYV